VQVGGTEGGSADVEGVVPGPVRDGLSPPRRASWVTAGCEARGRSPRAPVPSGSYRQGEDRRGAREGFPAPGGRRAARWDGRTQVNPRRCLVTVTPADGMHQRGRRDWPLGSGRCRPESICRPGAHHRPRGQGGALPGRVLRMRNMTTPMGSGTPCAGRPTVRKVQLPSGRRMTQEANAGSRKGNRKPGR
jgi:hypothetical protein